MVSMANTFDLFSVKCRRIELLREKNRYVAAVCAFKLVSSIIVVTIRLWYTNYTHHQLPSNLPATFINNTNPRPESQ